MVLIQLSTHPSNSTIKSFQGVDGKYYFTLHASNGEPIGKSEGYNNSFGRDQGKENCKKEAPTATVHEFIGAMFNLDNKMCS